MGFFDSIFGYSDKKASFIAHYLKVIVGKGANQTNLDFFAKCNFSPIETDRLYFCTDLYNLSVVLVIIAQKYSLKSDEMQTKVFNAFCQYLDKSPSNFKITDYVVYNQEVNDIVNNEMIPIDYTTNQLSFFNMVWKTRGVAYRRMLWHFPELRPKNRRNPEENHPDYKPINNFPEDYPIGFNFKEELHKLFIKHFYGESNIGQRRCNLIEAYLYSHRKALVSYLWPANYEFP